MMRNKKKAILKIFLVIFIIAVIFLVLIFIELKMEKVQFFVSTILHLKMEAQKNT